MERDQKFEVSRENLEWLRENYENLKKEYDSCWIIIQDKKVVTSASSFDEIIKVVRKRDPDKILVEYIQSQPVAMFF